MASQPQPNPPTEVPEYELLQQCFFEPERLEAGTRILYHGIPGNHMRPLNAAAEAKMEEFYEAEFPELHEKTGERTGRMIKPRQILRPVAYTPAEMEKVTVTALPSGPALHANVQSLADMAAAKRSTNQRPPPSPVPVAVAVPTPAESEK